MTAQAENRAERAVPGRLSDSEGPEISARTSQALAQALQPEPGRRFPSVDAFEHALAG